MSYLYLPITVPSTYLRNERPAALLYAHGAFVEVRIAVPFPRERSCAIRRVASPSADIRPADARIVEPRALEVRAHEGYDIGQGEGARGTHKEWHRVGQVVPLGVVQVAVEAARARWVQEVPHACLAEARARESQGVKGSLQGMMRMYACEKASKHEQ